MTDRAFEDRFRQQAAAHRARLLAWMEELVDALSSEPAEFTGDEVRTIGLAAERLANAAGCWRPA